jgi:hypothetical protein
MKEHKSRVPEQTTEVNIRIQERERERRMEKIE